MVSGQAKAVTPFGPLAGRTPVTVSDFGADSAYIDFHCGSTPVSLALAGGHLVDFIDALIDKVAEHQANRMRARLASALDDTGLEESA